MAAQTVDLTVLNVKIKTEYPFNYSRYGNAGIPSIGVPRQAVLAKNAEGLKYWFKLPADCPHTLVANDEIRVRLSVATAKEDIVFANRVKLLGVLDANFFGIAA